MLATMKSSSRQPELLSAPPALSGSTMANPHVCVQTEGNHRAILVHGIVFSHLFPLLHPGSRRGSLRHGYAFRIRVRRSKPYRSLVRLFDANSSPPPTASPSGGIEGSGATLGRCKSRVAFRPGTWSRATNAEGAASIDFRRVPNQTPEKYRDSQRPGHPTVSSCHAIK